MVIKQFLVVNRSYIYAELTEESIGSIQNFPIMYNYTCECIGELWGLKVDFLLRSLKTHRNSVFPLFVVLDNNSH